MTTLLIRYNNIGDQGAKYLADALTNNKVHLNILLFSNSYLNDFFCLKTLKKLDLTRNQIGDQGAQNLATTFKNNTVNLTFTISFSFVS